MTSVKISMCIATVIAYRKNSFCAALSMIGMFLSMT